MQPKSLAKHKCVSNLVSQKGVWNETYQDNSCSLDSSPFPEDSPEQPANEQDHESCDEEHEGREDEGCPDLCSTGYFPQRFLIFIFLLSSQHGQTELSDYSMMSWLLGNCPTSSGSLECSVLNGRTMTKDEGLPITVCSLYGRQRMSDQIEKAQNLNSQKIRAPPFGGSWLWESHFLLARTNWLCNLLIQFQGSGLCKKPSPSTVTWLTGS